MAALCWRCKDQQTIDRFSAQNVESVEACAMPGIGQVQTGIQAGKGKNQWWIGSYEIQDLAKVPVRMATGSFCSSRTTWFRSKPKST